MGKSSTSFKKGAPGRPDGTKNKKTLQWEAIGDFLINDGANRAVKIMRECKDDKFMDYFNQLLEYFKPKLARTEITGKDGEKLNPPTIVVQSPEGEKEVQKMIDSVNK